MPFILVIRLNFISDLCSQYYNIEGMEVNEAETMVYYLSPTNSTAVQDVPDFCAGIEMEIFMPKEPEQWYSFKSIYGDALTGNIMGAQIAKSAQ